MRVLATAQGQQHLTLVDQQIEALVEDKIVYEGLTDPEARRAAVDLLPPLCPRCFSDSGCTQGEMSIMGSERSFIGGGVEGLLLVLVGLCRVEFVE